MELNPFITFNQYQGQAQNTAFYPSIGGREIYPALELANEAGEVLGKIKKIYRDKDGEYSDSDRAGLKGEIGDCLWALAMLATELHISLNDAAKANLEKLASRKERGALGGSGDNR